MSDHVSAEHLEALRLRLEARIAEIDIQVARSDDQTSAVAPDNAIGRLSRVDAVQAGYISDEVRRQITADRMRIQRALRMIAENNYGLCVRCQGEISVARLDAQPDATLCIDCAAAPAVVRP